MCIHMYVSRSPELHPKPKGRVVVCASSLTALPSARDRGGCAQSYLEQNVRLAEERSEMEGRVSEAERSQRAAETAQRRLELEKQSLKQHNDWLDAELSSKADQLLTQRKEASEQVRCAGPSPQPALCHWRGGFGCGCSHRVSRSQGSGMLVHFD